MPEHGPLRRVHLLSPRLRGPTQLSARLQAVERLHQWARLQAES